VAILASALFADECQAGQVVARDLKSHRGKYCKGIIAFCSVGFLTTLLVVFVPALDVNLFAVLEQDGRTLLG
jgi:hypothetical protein